MPKKKKCEQAICSESTHKINYLLCQIKHFYEKYKLVLFNVNITCIMIFEYDFEIYHMYLCYKIDPQKKKM